MTDLKSSLTYQDAGVNINAGNEFINRIKPIAEKTRRPGVLNGLGGFGALFEIPQGRYREPILVSSTDGVGTKLKLAQAMRKYDTIGIDLVAMCVNDIIVQGAEPLFFLDYFSTGHLELNMATAIMEGICAGCESAGAALIGGETAEMPGVYQAQDYDLAGFSVGVVEKNAIIDGQKVKPTDAIIGLASSGIHANGFSLVRSILNLRSIDINTPFKGSTLGDTLLEPTRIYVKTILSLISQIEIHAIAHITGGGLLENIPRVLPQYTQAALDSQSWFKPPIFDWIQEKGNISFAEMYRTFNNGIGMVICVPETQTEQAMTLLKAQGETAWLIGSVEPSHQAAPQVIIR